MAAAAAFDVPGMAGRRRLVGPVLAASLLHAGVGWFMFACIPPQSTTSQNSAMVELTLTAETTGVPAQAPPRAPVMVAAVPPQPTPPFAPPPPVGLPLPPLPAAFSTLAPPPPMAPLPMAEAIASIASTQAPSPARTPAPQRPPQRSAPVSRPRPTALTDRPVLSGAPPGPATTVASGAAATAPSNPPLIAAPRFRRPPRPPDYPPRAIELDLTGTVIVRALLDPEGDPREMWVHRSSGSPMLDGAALAAVRDWAFEPASRDGQRIPAWVEVPVNFRLN